MRDSAATPNVGTASTPASATTDPTPDTDPPTPDPMTWATAPYATGAYSIAMLATTATDPSGVEYWFDETSGNPGGTDSGWQDSASYEDTGLSPSTQYTYCVTARDKSINLNHMVIYRFAPFLALLNVFVVLFNLGAAISRLLASW